MSLVEYDQKQSEVSPDQIFLMLSAMIIRLSFSIGGFVYMIIKRLSILSKRENIDFRINS